MDEHVEFRKSDNQLRGRHKIRGTKHGGEHEKYQEPRSNMSDPEDTLSGKNTKTKTKNKLTVKTINQTHRQAKEREDREEPQGKIQVATPQTSQSHLRSTTR